MTSKRNKYSKCIFLLAAAGLFTSCSTMSYMPIEIADKPPEMVDHKIQSLTLINRATDFRFENFNKDTLQQSLYKKQFKTDTLLFDSNSADTLLIALGDMLFESGRFDIVIPEEREIDRNTNRSYPVALDWEKADSIATAFNTDGVLSLDHFRTRLITNYEKETLYDQMTNSFYSGYYVQMKVGYDALFRLYYPEEKELTKNILITDTLIWEDADTDIRTLFGRFTPAKDALAEAGIHAALRLSEKIAPVWQRVNRSYFSKGHPLLEEAHRKILEEDWESAAKIWTELTGTGFSKDVRSKAEFNLALANELLGDLNKAIEWGIKSYRTRYRPVTHNYLETLNLRKKRLEEK